MIARLTGTEIANASMYDGATAMAEAAVLCAKMSNRTKIIVALTVHPEYRQVLRTILGQTAMSCRNTIRAVRSN